MGRQARSMAGTSRAEVAELVDALASGASGGNPVEVQVLSSVPEITFNTPSKHIINRLIDVNPLMGAHHRKQRQGDFHLTVGREDVSNTF